MSDSNIIAYRSKLKCSFQQLDRVFPDCMAEALIKLTPQGIEDYLDGATKICTIGRGFEPVLAYLEEMPDISVRLGESSIKLISDTVWNISRTPNGKSIRPFLETLGEVTRRLVSIEQLINYIEIINDMMERTTVSIHGIHATIPSPSLSVMLGNISYLLNQLSLDGFKNWVEYGISHYQDHPERQQDYFSLQSPDSRAIMQRERHGTLYSDNERLLGLYLKALWDEKAHLVPYSPGLDADEINAPYFDQSGVRLPDVYDDRFGVAGIDRYRALLAHVAAHMKWTSSVFADNFSPYQRMAIEVMEDSRVEFLAIQKYPGLRTLWIKLHPIPIEGDCDTAIVSCVRHRLTMLSYAILNPNHIYTDGDIVDYAEQFNRLMKSGDITTDGIVDIAIKFVVKVRRQSDQAAKVYFKDTLVDYRDDNRHMWKYIELGDEEDSFEDQKRLSNDKEEIQGLPPRHYPEWDYTTKTFRPDWVSVYESLHEQGDPSVIDRLLAKHALLAKRLKQLLDLLKPQQQVRIRYQEDGSELDLDIAVRSLIDYRCGANPDPRINMSHRTDGRDIAVMLLMDLSESINQVPQGCNQTILELSQEAVALMGWAIEKLGDEFSIAGFSSNTRHEVRYQHIKGFGEQWNDTVKSRLSAIEAGYSTRMGAALRHAGHYLEARKADKKLLLVLTDGEPSDIDAHDERLLIEDARIAVKELKQQGIYTHCINLDPHADEYVGDIFGTQYTVIDRVDRLPEKLPHLFMALTK